MKQNIQDVFKDKCINLVNEKGVSFQEVENKFIDICEIGCDIKEAKKLMVNSLDEAENINNSLLRTITLVEKKNLQEQEIDTQEIKQQVLDVFSQEYKRTYESTLNNYRKSNDCEM